MTLASDPPTESAPLDGIVVVEVDTDVQAQFAGRILRQLGATVRLVEPAAGSAVRKLPPHATDTTGVSLSVPFEYLNADKTTISCSSTRPDSLLEIRAATDGADIVLVGADCWQLLDCDVDAAVTVIYSLYGASSSSGTRATAPSSPFTRYHAGGDGYFLPTSADPSLRPTVPGYLIGDCMAGVGVVNAALHGLNREEFRRRRQVIDFSQQAYNVTMNKMFVAQSSYYGTPLDRFTHTYPFGGNLACSDGYIAMLILEGHQWRGLCHMVGAPQWLDDERYADGVLRRKNGHAVDMRVKQWCRQRSTAQVIAAGREHDVPIGLVATPPAVLAGPGLRARRFVRPRSTVFGVLDTVGLPFGPDFAVAPRPQSSSSPDGPQSGSTDAGVAVRGNTTTRVPPPWLDGLKVLDLTWAGAGPIITWTLAAMGADVAKVEHPSRPDLLRRANRTYGWKDDDDLDGSPAFNEMNSGKKSVVIDLRSAAGRALALELAAVADVVCESMRPGRAEALGLGYDDVRAVNANVVYCSLSGTGRGTGTANVPGYAPVFWAEGGGAWLTGWPEAAPDYVRSPVDMHAGQFACAGILAALHRRRIHGEGAHIDLSAVEAVSTLVGDALLAAALGLPSPGRRGNDVSGDYLLNDVFPCAGHEQWIAISAREQDITALAAELDIGAALLANAGDSAMRWKSVARATETRAADQLEMALQSRGLAASRVNSLLQLLADPGLHERGYWHEVGHPVLGIQRLSGLPWNVDGVPDPDRSRSPLLDEHTDRVLTDWLSLDPARIGDLRASGSVGGKQHPSVGAT